jgi:hypothetical protein
VECTGQALRPFMPSRRTEPAAESFAFDRGGDAGRLHRASQFPPLYPPERTGTVPHITGVQRVDRPDLERRDVSRPAALEARCQVTDSRAPSVTPMTAAPISSAMHRKARARSGQRLREGPAVDERHRAYFHRRGTDVVCPAQPAN